jgi:tetratricopeptide (TPR) repeat protein
MKRKQPFPAVFSRGLFFLIFSFFVTALTLTNNSCVFPQADEETFLLYARAAGTYSEGRFSETARMLSDQETFVPALVLRGKAEYFSHENEAAERSFRRALKLRPAGAEASLCLARVLRDRGELEEAETLTEAILGDDPSNIRALRLAADLSRLKGPVGEAPAADLLDRAAEASSEAALVFLDRARLRWIGGNGEGALEDLRKARILLPWDTPLIRSVENLESVIKEFIK